MSLEAGVDRNGLKTSQLIGNQAKSGCLSCAFLPCMEGKGALLSA